MTSFVFDVVNVAEQELVALLQAAMAEPSMASPLLPDEAKAGCLTRLGTIIAASVRVTNTRTPRLVSGERLFKTGIRIFPKCIALQEIFTRSEAVFLNIGTD